jgi:hypothetical protein
MSPAPQNTIQCQQSFWKTTWPRIIRTIFKLLPWVTLNALLVGGGLWAAYIFLPSRPFNNKEISRLKSLAEQQSNATANLGNPPQGQLSADEVKKLKSLAANPATPIEQFTPADAQALKGLAQNSTEIMRNKLDAEEMGKFKEDVKGYLEWIIAIAGIFTIAQTIAAGFVAQSFTSQAERDIAQLNDFKKEYRVLARAGQAQQVAFDVLKEALKDYLGEDWLVDRRGDFYAGMSVVKRQTILSADRYLGYDLLLYQGGEPDSELAVLRLEASKLRGLAIFYVSKYEHEQKLNSGQWQDLERAHHLLQSGIQINSSDFQLHNDLGVVLIKCADQCRQIGKPTLATEFQEKAKAEFQTSVCLQRKQQRAYFNLSRIACDEVRPTQWPTSSPTETAAFKIGLREAERLAKLAYEMPNWETKPNSAMKNEVSYNLACFRALSCFCDVKDATQGTPQWEIPHLQADPVIAGLEAIAGPNNDQGTILKRYVENDFINSKGDLNGFIAHLSPADAGRMATLKDGLSAKAAQE